MSILISTNMYVKQGELSRVLPYLEGQKGRFGVEVFPMFHWDSYEAELGAVCSALKKVPISFHGPYYRSEHSAPKGSADYERTMGYIRKTLQFCRQLHGKYVVFHHNNCRVTEETREDMIRNSCENYREVEGLFACHGIPVAAENVGVGDRGNVLFDEPEFIDLCKRERYPVLIDIGHANANGWDLDLLIRELKAQIISFHVHNNDGVHDSHQRIRNGTLDFDAFAAAYWKYTPYADIVLEYAADVSDDEDGIRADLEELSRIF